MKLNLSVFVILLVAVMGGVCFASFDHPQLVHEWKFEGDALDTSDNGNDGVWDGTEAYGTGVSGQAASLDGSSSILKVDVASRITDLFNEPYGDNGWTMNIWVNMAVADISDWACIAGIGNSADLSGRFIHQGETANGNTVQFSGFGPWGFLDDTQENVTYKLNDWTMVTVVARYSSFSVYVDGVHKTGNQLDEWTNAGDMNRSEIFIGLPNRWHTVRFSGLVDEYTIWDGPMDVNAIAALYTAFDPNYSTNPSPGNGGNVARSDEKILSWTPSINAGDQILYFGSDYNDVVAATETSPEYQATLASGVTSYEIDVESEFGNIYFWRVDAVDSGSGLWKGKIWSFNVVNKAFDDNYSTDPVPTIGASISKRNKTLSWTPSVNAGDQDIYLGTDFNDVNAATETSPEYQATLASDANSYVIDIQLLPAETYYWRVDAVDAGDGLWKGDIWTFNILPKASMEDFERFGKVHEWKFEDNALDSSGSGHDGTWSGTETYGQGIAGNAASLDGSSTVRYSDLPTSFTDLFNEPGGDAGWTMNVWVNMAVEDISDWAGIAGIGNPGNIGGGRLIHQSGTNTGNTVQFTGWGPWGYLDDQTAGYALNDWTMVTVVAKNSAFSVYVDGVHKVGNQLDTWANTPDLAGNDIFIGMPNMWTTTKFSGLIDEFSVWSEPMEAEDVMLLFTVFEVDPNYSYNPSPTDYSTGVAVDKALSWAPSVNAGDQNIYFSADKALVLDRDAGVFITTLTAAEDSYPIGDDVDLMLGETYYWCVDAVNDVSGMWEGSVWKFTVGDSIDVEDFDSYDLEGNSIAAVWTDKIGWGDIQMILANDPCLSQINSMRLRYHVPYDPYYAISARSFSPAQNWTLGGAKILSISYYGTENNFDLPMFVIVGDGTTDAKVVIADADTTVEGWQEIMIPLSEIEAAGVDLSSVSYMEIGFGDGTNLGMSSSKWDIIYVDDIKLYPPSCILSESGLAMDATGDCVTNHDDLAELNTYWLDAGVIVTVANPAVGPIVAYDFDDASGTTVADSVAGNDSTLNKVGDWNDIDGYDDGGYLDLAGNTNFDIPNDVFVGVDDGISVSIWVNHNGPFDGGGSDWEVLFHASDSTPTTRILHSHNPTTWGSISFVTTNNGSMDQIAWNYDSDADYADVWNHYVYVKDVVNGRALMYHNGILVAQGGGMTDSLAGIEHFWVGSNAEGLQFQKGKIDDLKIYDYPLSQAEVLALNGVTPGTVYENPLSAEADAVDGVDDNAVNMLDFALLANEWLEENLWP